MNTNLREFVEKNIKFVTKLTAKPVSTPAAAAYPVPGVVRRSSSVMFYLFAHNFYPAMLTVFVNRNRRRGKCWIGKRPYGNSR